MRYNLVEWHVRLDESVGPQPLRLPLLRTT